MDNDLPILAFVASPLQMASLRLSTIDEKEVQIIGHRGMSGDVTWTGSALNDPRFLIEFEKLIGNTEVEVFLPNSLNALYYLCAGHPLVARISYLDEGRLTRRAIEYQHRNPSHWATHTFRAAFRAGRCLPQSFQSITYRVLCVLLRSTIVRPYEHATANYAYRTIERRWKPGRILCHVHILTSLPDVEHVDLLKDLEFPRDAENDACLFLHPSTINTQDKSNNLLNKILSTGQQFRRLLIKPHPTFVNYSNRLEALKVRLDKENVQWAICEISGRQEVSIEMYARGARVFFLPSSTIEDTIIAMPDFFSEIKCINI